MYKSTIYITYFIINLLTQKFLFLHFKSNNVLCHQATWGISYYLSPISHYCSKDKYAHIRKVNEFCAN